MLSIDEVIARERQQAEEQRNHIDTWDEEYSKKCEVYAKEHEQIAEWLELLKWYEQGMEDIPCESGVLPKDVYWAGYNKSIDDFVKFASDMPTVEAEDGTTRPMWLEEIAEKLKAGEQNEHGSRKICRLSD